MDSAYVPFSFPDVYQGFATGGGIATANAMGLTLEFQVKDGFFGVIKSGVHKVDITLGDLQSVVLKQNWLRNRLFIKVRSMAILADVPGSDRGQVELRVARSDMRAAQSLVSLLTLSLSEKQLAELHKARLTS